jgi:hypothetical protein
LSPADDLLRSGDDREKRDAVEVDPDGRGVRPLPPVGFLEQRRHVAGLDDTSRTVRVDDDGQRGTCG